MAAFTQGDKSFIAALGPFKIEVLHLTTPSNGDTIVSKLANPSFAVALTTGNANGANDLSASLSSSTVTVHNPPNSKDVVVIVFGDSIKKLTS